MRREFSLSHLVGTPVIRPNPAPGWALHNKGIAYELAARSTPRGARGHRRVLSGKCQGLLPPLGRDGAGPGLLIPTHGGDLEVEAQV